MPVSVLLTRKAGPHTPVSAELQLGVLGEDQSLADRSSPLPLRMTIDGQSAGELVVEPGTTIVSLSAQQAADLLAALAKSASIAWSDGARAWRLSSAGAAAVLEQMDAFQGRPGTPGALLRKGARDEGSVLPPVPAPVLQAAGVPADDSVRLPASRLNTLRAALLASAQACAGFQPGATAPEISLRRLSATKWLASMPCTVTAYNDGAAYWVVKAAAPYTPQLVALHASDYADGTLRASMKLHSSGDCWSFAVWTWDGKRFVPTAQETTGACKSIAPDGAWSLPLLVSTVRPAPAASAATRTPLSRGH